MCQFVFSFILYLSVDLTFSSYPLTLLGPNSCKKNEYYDTLRLTCLPCADGEQGKYQMHSKNRMFCLCKDNHKLTSINGNEITCSPCPANQVTSIDGWDCSVCSAENLYDNTTEKCSPCINSVVVERKNLDNDREQFCSPCENSTWPDSQAFRCVRCPQSLLEASKGKCECPNEFMMTGGFCIEKPLLLPSQASHYTVRFENGVSLHSSFFVQHFQAVVYNCKSEKNITACQTLANMCVLLYYNMDNYRYHSGKSDACSEYLKYTVKETIRPRQWPSHSPWIYYLEGDAKAELLKSNVPHTYSPNPKFGTDKLHFIMAKYSLDGQFFGYEQFTESSLKICSIPGSNLDSLLRFGTAFETHCEKRVKKFWNDAELYFYELFLSTNDSLEHNLLYPVPVRILNYQSDGVHVNREPDMSKWQLVRRFFLYDPVSGIENGQPVSKQPRIAKFFRYAAHLSLEFKAQKDGKPGAICPPLLSIEYAELSLDDYHKNDKVMMKFTVTYSMDERRLYENIAISVGVLSGLGALWSLIQAWGWSKRAGREVIDLAAFGKLLIFVCGNLSSVFFIVILICALSWTFFYKKQDVFYIFLPTSDLERTMKIYLIIGFIMKAIELIHLLSVQCRTDVFFIDWERARNLNSATVKLSPKSNEKGGIGESSTMLSTKREKLGNGRNSELPFISIWRTYFVADKWCEIQCWRRVSSSVHLLFVLFFLKVVGFENMAHADSSSSLSSEANHVYVPYSFTCRFAISSSIYIILAVIQLIIRRKVQERFFQDRLQDFVDLCSVSNISVFIMSSKRFGYYIHGRSVHGRADVNMKEMYELLRREEEDLCGHRGLLPNTEQQTFEMALPFLVRDQYDHLFLPLNSYSQAADRMQGAGGRLSKVDIDKVSNIYHMVNKFLCGFIEHAFKDLDYIIKDKLFLESILDIEFIDNSDKGCFYNDNGHSFDSQLLCGKEVNLIFFEVMLFIFVDVIAEDFMLAAMITLLVAKVIESLRRSFGRRNLVKKALIDERFLA